MKRGLLFLCVAAVIGCSLFQFDKYFLKLNDGFCIRNVLGALALDPHWETSCPPKTDLHPIFDQPFHYLAKGHQSYVFVSKDQKYVIKLYRFPSHMRVLSWLNHPLSSRFSKRRQEIMAYNLTKLDTTFKSYKIAYETLPEETGTLWIHLHPTTHLKKRIALIDRTGNAYTLPLDSLFFVIQRKAQLLFPALQEMVEDNNRLGAQRMIDSIVSLIVERSRKGIRDADPVLEKNYGWDGNRVLNIDVGRLIPDESQKDSEVCAKEVRKITSSLAHWLQDNQPELFEYYQAATSK